SRSRPPRACSSARTRQRRRLRHRVRPAPAGLIAPLRGCGLQSRGTTAIFTSMGEYPAGVLDRVFSAVSDPTRRAILARLADSDARVTDVASAFPISLNSTSKHIRVLEGAGLVRRTVRGREHFLSLDAAPLAEV